MRFIKSFLIMAFTATILFNCGASSAVISTPVENISKLPIKTSELTEKEKQTWSHLDLIKDTIPGMSVNKAYDQIIKNKKGKTTIVAVIDSGVDIDHEDLKDVIWTNTKEIANNGKDDDNNGYIDDIHGWNFLGNTLNEQYEYVRLLATGDTSNPNYAKAQAEYTKEHEKYLNLKLNYEQNISIVKNADDQLSKYFKKSNYTKDDVYAVTSSDQSIQESVALAKYVYSLDFESLQKALLAFNEDFEDINKHLNYYLNKNYKGRTTGDNPDDLTQKFYGNNNIKPIDKTESHGTHVAGIIAAERNNGKGVDGIANNVKIMTIRTVPDGDEHDKDVALAIKYAVDNGAKVINGSFGKYYSNHSNWVRDAIVYASKKDVLIVIAAGNDGYNLDNVTTYPNDADGNGPEVADNYIEVGAIEPNYGSNMVSYFSNYGKINVDIFAPGGKIYSTYPENEYETISGTSMASPAVAGVAALIRSQYPNLTASQVKHIILNSGLPITIKVIVPESSKVKPFSDLSKSGKIVNAYNALIMAQEISKNTLTSN
ncbi:MAG: S8 family peptidase [Gelidibacter sp.]|nr:S8 family peptidase [Gelidibacter sp.]